MCNINWKIPFKDSDFALSDRVLSTALFQQSEQELQLLHVLENEAVVVVRSH